MKRSFLFNLTIFAILLLAACGKSKDDPGTAQVMIINAVYGSAGVDVLAGGEKLNVVPLGFTHKMDYVSVKAGNRELKINQMNSNNLILSKNVSLAGGRKYTLLIYGQPNATAATLAEDDHTPVAGKAHVRYFNLAPGSAALTMGYMSGGAFKSMYPSRGVETETSILGNDGFTMVDPVPNATISLRNPANLQVVYSISGMSFPERQAMSVIYLGVPGQGLGAYIVGYLHQ